MRGCSGTDFYFTTKTSLALPILLGTRSLALGSLSQEPSTTNLYSYLPGLRLTLTDQLPLESFLAAIASGFQLLKVPVTLTRLASGALHLNTTVFFAIFYLLTVYADLFLSYYNSNKLASSMSRKIWPPFCNHRNAFSIRKADSCLLV